MWHFNIYNRIWTDFSCLQHHPRLKYPENLYRGWVRLVLLKANGAAIRHYEQHKNIPAWEKTLQIHIANTVGYLIPLLDVMVSTSQGHWWWTVMSESVLQRFPEREITICTNPQALEVMLDKGKRSKRRGKHWLPCPTSAQKIFGQSSWVNKLWTKLSCFNDFKPKVSCQERQCIYCRHLLNLSILWDCI